MGSVVVDRHVFASNASSFNTAWETFGWTPAIEGARAGRLEEYVPWATSAARAAQPAWLSGPAAEILDPANLDRIDSGFLPLDGRLGFSIWGAIGPRQRRGAEWRVATHTLLFDGDTFDLMAGHPQGLLTVPAVSGWFRTMVETQSFESSVRLDPIELERSRATRAAFESARRVEIRRLRDSLVVPPAGADRLEDELAGVFEALARARNGGPIRHVALRASADGRAERLIRLAWLALPLADRAETWFLTAQRRTEVPRATIFALPESEWGQFVPQATQLVDGRRASEPSAGRRRWARVIAQPIAPDEHAGWSARAEVRGWRVIGRDDISRADRRADWRERWRAGGDRPALARELIAIEAGAEPRARRRLRAAGHVAALAVRGSADGAETLASDIAEYRHAATILVRSAVRTLARGHANDRRIALRLRCRAVSGERPLVAREELFRLLERERLLLGEAAADPVSAELLFHAGVAAGLDGHAAAEPLIAAALPGLPTPEDELVALIASSDLDDPRAERLVLRTVDEALRRRPADVAPAKLALALLVRMTGGIPTPAQAERVLRLLAAEGGHGGETARAYLEQHGQLAVPVLAALLVAPAPLPLYFELRRLLLEAAPRVRHDGRLRQLLPALEEYCPALAGRLARAAAAP